MSGPDSAFMAEPGAVLWSRTGTEDMKEPHCRFSQGGEDESDAFCGMPCKLHVRPTVDDDEGSKTCPGGIRGRKP